MKSYLKLLEDVLEQGKWKENRTGVEALTLAGAIFQHSMTEGFPLLTTKKMAFKSVKVELEFFIKGLTDKSWLQERGCTIWDEWCNPKKIPSNLNEEARKKFQLTEQDLGKVYGYQWNNFNGVNQLKKVVETLKSDPNNRRMIVSAWNPTDLGEMALPPCHVLFHLVVLEDTLNLSWFQRSCDLALGIPFNIASYGLLLELLAKESGLKAGALTGMLSDVHIYKNHIDGVKEQLTRSPMALGRLETTPYTSLWEWEYSHSRVVDYKSHPRIPLPISV